MNMDELKTVKRYIQPQKYQSILHPNATAAQSQQLFLQRALKAHVHNMQATINDAIKWA